MHEVEIVLGLLLVVAVLVLLADKLRVPYPILLVLGGLAISFVPGLPRIEPEPGLVFLIFLPPIIQAAAYNTSIRDFRANFRSILLLAIGLPIFTMIVVAVVAHSLVEGMTWPAAFVLGAIVSPPDAVAATSIAQKLGLPRRIVTILEGESLLNDATALVAYRLGVAAVLTGVFSFGEAAFRFLLTAIGGVIVGWVVGMLAVWLFKRIDDPPIEITLQLLSGYGSYLLAEALGVSGVVALVAIGFVFGRMGSTIMSPRTRTQAASVWQIVVFVLNGLIFILIGLHLPVVLESLSEYSFGTLLLYAGAISLAVILARIVWMPFGAYVPRYIINKIKGRIHEEYPPLANAAVVSWAGMRGMVSLAAALSIPLTAGSEPFPARHLIIFLTFAVILVTLLVQGLSLPILARVLGVRDDDSAELEEKKARLHAAEAGALRLEELAREQWASADAVADLRAHYHERKRLYSDGLDGDARAELEREAVTHIRIRREVLEAERHAIIRLRDDGAINDEVLHLIERDLDLEVQSLRS